MTMKDKTRIELMIKCGCVSPHAIELTYLSDPEPMAYICLWYGASMSTRLGIVDRIKAIWDILTTGYVLDCISLDQENIEELRIALSRIKMAMIEDREDPP
jgi:hypothetical protein